MPGACVKNCTEKTGHKTDRPMSCNAEKGTRVIFGSAESSSKIPLDFPQFHVRYIYGSQAAIRSAANDAVAVRQPAPCHRQRTTHNQPAAGPLRCDVGRCLLHTNRGSQPLRMRGGASAGPEARRRGLRGRLAAGPLANDQDLGALGKLGVSGQRTNAAIFDNAEDCVRARQVGFGQKVLDGPRLGAGRQRRGRHLRFGRNAIVGRPPLVRSCIG